MPNELDLEQSGPEFPCQPEAVTVAIEGDAIQNVLAPRRGRSAGMETAIAVAHREVSGRRPKFRLETSQPRAV